MCGKFTAAVMAKQPDNVMRDIAQLCDMVISNGHVRELFCTDEKCNTCRPHVFIGASGVDRQHVFSSDAKGPTMMMYYNMKCTKCKKVTERVASEDDCARQRAQLLETYTARKASVFEHNCCFIC